jgi:hypothetical protein
MTPRDDIFTWRFLDDVAWWGIGLAALCAVVGAVLTEGWSFPVTCLFVAGVDMICVHFAARRGGRAVDRGAVDPLAIGLFAGRLVFKAIVLVLALIFPAVISFWGAVAGALAYDTALAVAGGIMSAARMRPAGR